MFGASRTSIAALREHLDALYAGNTKQPALLKFIGDLLTSGIKAAGFSTGGEGLLAIVDVLDRERSLRIRLADPASSPESRDAIANALFDGKVSPLALGLFRMIIDSRWSSDADMVDATEEAGATLLLMAAETEGSLDKVEEELFRFGRAIDANADLQMALTDPATSPEVKSGIVTTLLDGKAETVTVLLLSHTTSHLRGRRIQDAVTALSELAGRRRGQLIANVRTAVSLSKEQAKRLTKALAQLHGRDIELNVIVDESVVGGIEVQIGDEVFDGTISSKLEQARRRMTG